MLDETGQRSWFHTHERKVEFGDLDAMGHLNNVVFLRYFETARIDFLGDLVPEHDPSNPNDFGLIFAECHINYRSPAHYGERFVVRIRPGEVWRSAFKIEFRMEAGESERLVAEGWGVLVSYSYPEEHSAPLPDHVRRRLLDAGAVEAA